jgi:hypothetical protein
MPAESILTIPERTIKMWLGITASAGVSFSVGIKYLLSLIFLLYKF